MTGNKYRERKFEQPCSSWKDFQLMSLGWDTAPIEWFEPRFDTLRERSPWLKLIRCRTCGAAWYVGIDTVYDDYYFQRVTEAEVHAVLEAGLWPKTFDIYERFWPYGMTSPDFIPEDSTGFKIPQFPRPNNPKLQRILAERARKRESTS